MRRLLAVLTGGVALTLWMAGTAPASAEEGRRILSVASGEVTGYYFPVAGALCRVLNKDRPDGRLCAVIPTSGTSANVAALRSGDADLAILQSRAAAQALSGGEGFKDGPLPELRALMSLHGEAALVMTRPGSGIEKMADLKGHRVNLGRPGSFQRSMADAVLSAAGLSEGDLGSAVELDLSEVTQELCAGNIDAAVFSGVHPMAEVAGAIEQCGALPVPQLVRQLDAVVPRTPWLSREQIRGDTYDGIREAQPALAVRAVLAATTRLSADEVYDILKAIHANFAAMVRLHPALKGLAKADTAHEGIAIPLHDGAQRFYAESGRQK